MNDPLGLGVIAGARPEPGWFVRREPQPWHAALPKWIWATNLELPWFGIHDCFAPEARHSSVAFWGDGQFGGATRLWFLAREFESCEAIRWLLAQGADVEIGNPLRGSTPLHGAAINGSIPVAAPCRGVEPVDGFPTSTSAPWASSQRIASQLSNSRARNQRRVAPPN